MKAITNEQFENLLQIVADFSFGEVEELVSFEELNDEQRQNVAKIVMKTVEISTIINSKFYSADSFKSDLLTQVSDLQKESKYEEISGLLNS